jgi:CRP-like cAMP-binding protein
MTTQATQTYPNSNVIAMNDELKTQLRTVPILSSLKDDELYCLDTVHEIRAQEGEYIARQGEMAHFFWILLEGELQVSQTQSDGREVDMYVMKPGAAFGEVPLLANIPNAVNARPIGSAHLLQLSEDEFWKLMTSCPEVRKAILGNMAIRLQKMQGMMVQQEKRG